jgi:hypothetical protein
VICSPTFCHVETFDYYYSWIVSKKMIRLLLSSYGFVYMYVSSYSVYHHCDFINPTLRISYSLYYVCFHQKIGLTLSRLELFYQSRSCWKRIILHNIFTQHRLFTSVFDFITWSQDTSNIPIHFNSQIKHIWHRWICMYTIRIMMFIN